MMRVTIWGTKDSAGTTNSPNTSAIVASSRPITFAAIAIDLPPGLLRSNA